MRRIRTGILFIVSILLTACGSNEDFKNAEWGMTSDQVINLEKESGNELFEEDADSDGISLEFEDLIINGLTADVEYIFSNEVDKVDVYPVNFYFEMFKGFTDKMEDESLSEEEQNKIQEEYAEESQKMQEEYDSIPDVIKLHDFVLVEGKYWFYDIDEEDSKGLYESLVEIYGEPDEQSIETDSSRWTTDRTQIYFDGDNYIRYSATLDALEDYTKANNKGKKSGNDL